MRLRDIIQNKKKRSWFIFHLVLGLASCATPSTPPQIQRDEVRKEDLSLGEALAFSLERGLPLVREATVEAYLSELADRIIHGKGSDSLLRAAPAQASVFRADKDKLPTNAGFFEGYAFPGHRLYLSLAFLKTVKFENELAALLAFHLAAIQKRMILNKFDLGRKAFSSRPGVPGLLDLTDAERLELIPVAAELLYGAGYDPRGLPALWERFREKSAPGFSRANLTKLQERAREEIAHKSPLLNPIVRTPEFLKFRERVSKL